MPLQVFKSCLPPLMSLPLWVTGRYYESFVMVSSPTGVGSMGSNTYLMPILVPNQVTATSIGIEPTTTTSDGRQGRFCIYQSGLDGLPSTLLLDAGLVVIDTAGFAAAAISQRLLPGFYWIGFANESTTSIRGYNTGSALSGYSGANLQIPNISEPNSIIVSNGANLKNGGFPYEFYSIINSTGTISIGANLTPRILIGV